MWNHVAPNSQWCPMEIKALKEARKEVNQTSQHIAGMLSTSILPIWHQIFNMIASKSPRMHRSLFIIQHDIGQIPKQDVNTSSTYQSIFIIIYLETYCLTYHFCIHCSADTECLPSHSSTTADTILFSENLVTSSLATVHQPSTVYLLLQAVYFEWWVVQLKIGQIFPSHVFE